MSTRKAAGKVAREKVSTAVSAILIRGSCSFWIWYPYVIMSMIAPELLMPFVNHIVRMLWISEDILSSVLRQTRRIVDHLN